MKHATKLYALVGAFTLAVSPGAFAAGTTSGTTISNTATVNYSVNGSAQDEIGSSPTGNTAGAGTATTFVVDRKLWHTVTSLDLNGTVDATPNAAAVMQFQVKNEGNDTQDYVLSAFNRSAATDADYPGGVTDAFNTGGIQVYVESNGTAGYQPGGDLRVYIDELAPGDTRIVYVISTIPSSAINGQYAALSLVAQVAEGGAANTQGSAIVVDTNAHISPQGVFQQQGGGTVTTAPPATATAEADDPTTVQNVFADAASDVDSSQMVDDAQYNGQYSDTEVYRVVSANLTVSKTSAVFSDPVNGTTNPKAIPLAIVEYTITVENSGSAPATSIQIADVIPTNTTFQAGSIVVTAPMGSIASSSFAGNTVSVNVDTLATGATVTVAFKVQLN